MPLGGGNATAEQGKLGAELLQSLPTPVLKYMQGRAVEWCT